MNFKIPKSKFIFFIILILLYQVTFVKFPYISSYNIIRYSIIGIVGIVGILNIKKIIKVIDKKLGICVFIYAMIVIISGIKNASLHKITDTALGSIMYIIMFLELFSFYSLIKNEGEEKFIYKTYFGISTIYVLITDIFIICAPNLFMKSGEYYFIGNKFSVIYMHFNWLIFYMLIRKRLKLDFKFICIISLICCISIKIGCMTGIVGLLGFFILSILPSKITERRNFGIILLLGCGLFSILYEYILDISYVKYFITEVLHRSLNLTGRITIYENIPQILNGHLLLGYGHGSSYEVWINALHYPNSQNGLIDMIVEDGLLATIMFLILIKHIFRENNKIIKLIICTFFILSAFEITLGNMMIAWLALLYNNKNRKEVKE